MQMMSWSNPASCQHYTCHGRIKHLPTHLHSKCCVSFFDVNLFFSVRNALHAMNTSEREKSSAQIIVQNPVRAMMTCSLANSERDWGRKLCPQILALCLPCRNVGTTERAWLLTQRCVPCRNVGTTERAWLLTQRCVPCRNVGTTERAWLLTQRCVPEDSLLHAYYPA